MTDAKHTKVTRRDKSRAFDEALGAKVRAGRLGIRISLADLGSRLGVSYQQMQKYETGKDRLSAYALQQIAQILAMPVTAFLGDEPLPTGSIPVVRQVMKAVFAIHGIKDPKLRRRLLALIDELTKPDTSRAKQP